MNLPRGGGGRRERAERPAEAAGCTRRGEMEWSSVTKPGLQRAVAGHFPDQGRQTTVEHATLDPAIITPLGHRDRDDGAG
ncbi:hypothetical protein [Gluconobacter cerevisiae]|nr:hypothetical protein [Gluconobacter cerevisiae]